jgi:acyl-CoA thioester hydrolase
VKIHVPTVEQVDMLEPLIFYTVPEEWEDINRHVNVRHYLDLYNIAGDPMFEQLGIGRDYFDTHHRGFFDLEHHLWYLAEMHVGDRVSVHLRYLGRSAKRFHGVVLIVNRTRGNVASVLEFVGSGADLQTRRTAEFPPDVAERFDSMIAEHARLPWPAPTCGSIAP